MRQTELERQITDLVRPAIEDLGFKLVWVSFQSGTLQVMAEDPATGNLGLEDCTRISRVISPLMEVEDPIDGAYQLEVSSPGLERPLVEVEDYGRYIGREAKIELDAPMDGQRRFRGVIRGVEGEEILLDTDQGAARLPYGRVQKARLMLDEKMFKKPKPGGKKTVNKKT